MAAVSEKCYTVACVYVPSVIFDAKSSACHFQEQDQHAEPYRRLMCVAQQSSQLRQFCLSLSEYHGFNAAKALLAELEFEG
jgi:hypothetical protein